MCNDKKSLHRRDFLKGLSTLGAGAMIPTPIEMLIKSMATGFIQKAEAASALAGDPRNYINVMLAGAPSRYVFDQWVRTNASDPALIANPMVATKYISSGGRATGLEYATFNYNGVMVPHMFSHSVASGDGSQRPLTDLLKNTLVIRGYGTGLDGHPFNAQQQQSPVGGISSIAGAAADYSKKYFEAVQWPDRGAYQAYTSMEGKALNKISGNSPLNSLMEGFGPAAAPAARNLRERNQAAFDKAAAVLKSYANSNNFGASSLNNNMDNAMALMKKGVKDIDGYWSQAVARYQTVIQNSMRASGLLGISDTALISSETSQWSVSTAANPTGLIISSNFDLRSAVTTMTPSTFMAQGFALAEYILKEGLGTSIELFAPDIPNLSLAPIGGASTLHNGVTDMHETGAMASLVICTAYYRGLAAAILELSRSLGETNWNNTVLQVMGDFSRMARSSGTGSDHGFTQMATSVYSGAITNGPFVVGNVRKTGVNANYGGSQGVAASIDGYNQAGPPTPIMAASTVAALLNIPKNPFENLAAPLVKLEGGQLKVQHNAKMKDE
jgi:hypothetical protein